MDMQSRDTAKSAIADELTARAQKSFSTNAFQRKNAEITNTYSALQFCILANAMSMCTMFALNRDDAAAQIRDVVRVITRWKEHFKTCGVTKTDIDAYAEQIDRPFLRDQVADFR